MTGVRAYMSGKLKVRGDLMLAQKLEDVFNKTGGQEVYFEPDITCHSLIH
jgi:putative sterol carrier protein